ncbi:MAG: hypothetical protein ACI4WU_01910 [Bacilli bacterium]
MKKRYFILLGLVICLILTGCGGGSKEVKSTSDFDTVASNNGFTVNDNMSTYSGNDYITGAMVATTSDITIEMVIYDSVENANKVQEGQIDSFNLLKSTGASEKKDKGDNYYKYFLISNNYYMVSSRVDNTLIFCKTLLTNKEEVDKVLDELGY